MAITPLLSLPETSRAQLQWDQSINDAFAGLERATQDVKSIDFTAGDVALTPTDQNRYFMYECLSVTNARVLTLESSVNLTQASRRFVSVTSDANNTADVSIKVSGNATTFITLTPGGGVSLYVKGSEIFILGAYGLTSGAVSTTYDASVFVAGLPPANKEVYRLAVTQNLIMPIGLAGTRLSARVLPTAVATFPVSKNGTQVATLQFNTSGTHLASSAAVILLAPGDVLTIQSPVIQDATLEDVSMVIFGNKV